MTNKIKVGGWVAISIAALMLIILPFIRGCQKKQQEERAKTTLYSPPNIVSGSVIAFPDRWVRVPLTECKGLVITSSRPNHWMQRVNGDDKQISGPFTADNIPADGPVQSIDVRSYEPYPIEIVYSMIK